MNKPIVTTVGWTVVVCVLAAASWLAFRSGPSPCDFESVDRGPLMVTIDEDGRTRLKDRYIVSAPLAGRTDRITLKPGTEVEMGVTVLARIAPAAADPLDIRAKAQAQARAGAAEAAVARAESELARCETELEHLRAEYSDIARAGEANSVSRMTVADELVMLRSAEHSRDSARFALHVARFELEQARAALVHETADAAASDAPFEVRSPISGRVLRVFHESAGVVAPGTPLIELGSTEQLEVELDVLSDQAVKVRPGAKVLIDRWGGDTPLTGVVRVVEPSGYTKVSALGVEEQRVNVIVDFVDGPDARPALGDNFRVEARIVVWESQACVRVPMGAIFRWNDGWGVYVEENSRAVLREVDIGQHSDRYAEVIRGVVEGERVIVFPSDRVRDGVRVKARSAGA